MPAAYIRAVTGRILLVHLHIAQQPRPRVAAFQKIVAENAVFRETPVQRQFEGINVIDPLADERPFMEQVLIDVGNGAGVGIDARLAPIHVAHTATGSCRVGSRPPAAAGFRSLQRHVAGLRRRRAWFSGCAIAPTNCHAESRGSCVSVSRVITYFTLDKTPVSPTISEKLLRDRRATAHSNHQACLACARTPSRFAPADSSGVADETGRMCRFPDPGIFRSVARFSAGQAATAVHLRAGFLGQRLEISEQAEVEIVIPVGQEPDFQRLDQFLDILALVSIVGTTTRVRNSGGIPLEKSIRGSKCGVASSVASQFTRAIAR